MHTQVDHMHMASVVARHGVGTDTEGVRARTGGGEREGLQGVGRRGEFGRFILANRPRIH